MDMEQEYAEMGTDKVPRNVMTSAEVSAYLGVSMNTLQKWRTRNMGPKYIKYGNAKSATIRYDSKDVERFKTAHTVGTVQRID